MKYKEYVVTSSASEYHRFDSYEEALQKKKEIEKNLGVRVIGVTEIGKNEILCQTEKEKEKGPFTIFKLVECSDSDVEYGILLVENSEITEQDIREKISDFKNSYRAYGYSSVEKMKADGFDSIEELENIANAVPVWTVEQLVDEAFPDDWKVSFLELDGVMEV